MQSFLDITKKEIVIHLEKKMIFFSAALAFQCK